MDQFFIVIQRLDRGIQLKIFKLISMLSYFFGVPWSSHGMTKYIFQAMQPLLSRMTLLNKLYKHFSPGGVAQLVRATES